MLDFLTSASPGMIAIIILCMVLIFVPFMGILIAGIVSGIKQRRMKRK